MLLLKFHANNSVILCERNYVLMGMSATQARLLTITGRLTDNEMRSQTITNSKLRLAQKSSDASQEYMDALSSEKLVFKYYNDNGECSTYNLTPALLYSYEPLKNQYSIQNASGQNLVSATDANNFKNSGTLSEFLDKYGLAQDTTDADKYKTDMDEYNEKLDDYNKKLDKYNEKMKTYTEKYNKWLAAQNQPDLYAQFTAIVGTSKDSKSCYSNALTALEGGYMSGAGCYIHILAHLVDYDGTNNCSQKEYVASNGKTTKFDALDVSGSAINWPGVENEGSLSPKFKPLSDEIKKEEKFCDGDDNSDNGFDTKENLIQTAIDAGRVPTELEILKSDYVYDAKNNCVKKDEDGNAQLKTIRQKAIDLLYILKNNLISDPKEAHETLINFTDGDMKNLTGPKPEMPEKPVQPVKPDEPTYDFAVIDKDKAQWYINLWYMMNGSESANKLQNNTNANGETVYTAKDNLKNETNKNYKVIDDQLLTSNDWLTFALKNGVVTLKQATYFNPATDSGKMMEMTSEGYYWNSTAYSSTTDLVTVEDEVAIAKAEVKYKNTTTEIENQDKKYDQDLKKLDSEHNALQTEYESLKSVIDKNVERSFKAFS